MRKTLFLFVRQPFKLRKQNKRIQRHEKKKTSPQKNGTSKEKGTNQAKWRGSAYRIVTEKFQILKLE